MKILRDHAAVLDEPEPMVLVDSLGASMINLKLYFWIDGHKYSVPKIKSAIMRRVVRALERAQISLPDESREVIFPDGFPLPSASETPTQASSRVEAQRERDEAVSDSDLADQATDAESDLTSEVEEIKRQAAESRDPEKGPDIVS